jgi:hypothetical protein
MHRCRIFFLSALLTVLLSPRMCFPADGVSDGERWLKWNDEARVAYIDGYLWGLEGGYYEACRVAEKMWVTRPTGLPGEKCVEKMPKYSKSSNHYAELITDYYRSYPGDRGVLVRRLLQGLTDDHTETLQQLHEEFSHGGRTVNPN